MSIRLRFPHLVLLVALMGCPSTDDDDASDDDDVTDDDDATGDDDDSTGDDDDSTGDDDDSGDDDDATGDDDDSGDDDDATGDDDDATGDDDDATGDDDDSAGPTSCEEWSDAAVLAVVYGGPKVPAGYFVDTYPSNEFPQWGTTGCSQSITNTQGVASSLFTTGTLTGATRTTTEFYEVDVLISGGSYTVHFREHRCDYWDGSVLGGTIPFGWADLQWLSGYLWYSQNHNMGGHHILGGFGNIGSATDWFDLCHVTTVYGDFGLFDQITLKSTGHSVLQFQGDVNISAPVVHRTIQGNYN
jgi:hypothetical protein